MCDIFFLDYHRSERVPTSNILPRIPKWVVQEEAQAKCCALYGIQPVGSIFSNHHKKKQQLLMIVVVVDFKVGKTWSREAREYLMEELIDREFDIAWHGEDSRRSHPTQVIEILLE